MQKSIYNNDKVIVTKLSKNNQTWVCPNCLNYMKDDLCKIGYTVTCNKCDKEFEIYAIRGVDCSLQTK